MDETKEQICSFKELYKAMNECKKDVMWKASVSGYVKNGLVNCYKLQKQLMDGTYMIDKYSYFTITEPKTRNIVSTRMKEVEKIKRIGRKGNTYTLVREMDQFYKQLWVGG